MIVDTTPPEILEWRRLNEKQKHRSRKELESALRSYYIWHTPDMHLGGHVENLVQQGLDAADAVLAGYPPLKDAPHPDSST